MSDSTIKMAYANEAGEIFDHPDLELVAWDGDQLRPVDRDEVIPLPEGSDLFTTPGRIPIGFDPGEGEVVAVDEPGVTAVSCFLAPAYLRTLLPAYETLEDAPVLPLFAYSALGILDGQLVAPGLRVDPDVRQDPLTFDMAAVEAGVSARHGQLPDNRLVGHLEHCATVYHCRAAQNFFLDRFEAPLPAASFCNAACVGCISLQFKGGDDVPVSSHDRIPFAPTADELAGIALGHIERVGSDAVVSFGQGCEGEPLLAGDSLVGTIRRIREVTREGVINLNSNSSQPEVVRRMCEAGLDSIRVSTNSARPGPYAAYYRPSDYGFAQVRESARVVRDHGGYLMLNYFVFPGFTDTQEELDALSAWIEEDHVRMIQLRNLNIDPELYLEALGIQEQPEPPMGIVPWLEELQGRHPELRLGYFNPARRLFEAEPFVVG